MTPKERKKINVILATFMEPQPNFFRDSNTVSFEGWWKKTKDVLVPARDCTTDFNAVMEVAECLLQRQKINYWEVGRDTGQRPGAVLSGNSYFADTPTLALASACVEVIQILEDDQWGEMT